MIRSSPICNTLATCSPQDDTFTTIVVVTYNRLEQTKLCLDSVVAHTSEPHELIFVDNASSDDTVAYLRERFGDESVLTNDSNEGFLRAANRGIAAARGDYILLLNNDTTVTQGWLSALQRAAERSPDVGVVGGKIVGPDGRVQVAGAYMAFDGSARMIGQGLPVDHPSLSEEREVCYVGGHCMLIRRRVLDAVGPLDESYGFGYHEDTDYCYRARAAGFRVVYTPGCVVRHELFGTPLPQRQKIIFQNQQRFLRKWGNQLFLWRCVRPSVEFRADQRELPVGSGWFAAEADYTCTGREAQCYLQPPLEGSAILELVASAAHPDLSENPLHLEVLSGKQLVGHAFFNTPWELRQLFFPLPRVDTGPLRIDLRVDRTWKPDDRFRDGRDPREIGLAVHRMSIGTPTQARNWAAEGVPLDSSLQRLKDHLNYLEKAIADKDAFYTRELDGKELLISQLQANLERYHATPPFRAYFALKRMLGRS
ncbi:MAG: glycosyltransferase family 2 protein [Chloroflexota bacterium]